MDQPAFRVSLFRSAVGYRKLPFSANCRGRNRRTKLAIPLACDGFRETNDHQASKFGAGRNCVVLHSHELSIQDAKGPIGLPNFYGDRIVHSADINVEHRYHLDQPSDDAAQMQRWRFLTGTDKDVLSNGSLGRRPNAMIDTPEDVIYWSAPTIFLHIPKAAGNSVKELFVKGFLKDQRGKRHEEGHTQTQSLHIDTRRDWDLDRRSKKMHAVLYGAFAFGACASHSKAPCAYYVVFHRCSHVTACCNSPSLGPS